MIESMLPFHATEDYSAEHDELFETTPPDSQFSWRLIFVIALMIGGSLLLS